MGVLLKFEIILGGVLFSNFIVGVVKKTKNNRTYSYLLKKKWKKIIGGGVFFEKKNRCGSVKIGVFPHSRYFFLDEP